MQQDVRIWRIDGINRVEMKQSEKRENTTKPLYVGKLKCEKQATFQQRRFQQVHHQWPFNQKLPTTWSSCTSSWRTSSQRRWLLHLSNHSRDLQHKQQGLRHLAQLQPHQALNVFKAKGEHVQVLEVDSLHPQKIQLVQSPIDINWSTPLCEQLEPQVYGEVNLSPEPCQSSKKATAWILNGIQWFTVLEQPTMIAIWTKDWKDAANFQHLMQILQVNFGDYIPKWRISVEQPEHVDRLILQWQSPTTVWTGHPVIGFMAETDFEDRTVMGFADFNPMWSFPTHAVTRTMRTSPLAWIPLT